jgi:hypothetical protein
MKKRAIINWSDPKVSKESDEYFSNRYTRIEFKKYGLVFKTKTEFLNFCKENGKYKVIAKDELLRHNINNMTTTVENFKRELAEYSPKYRKSFESMINYAIKHGSVTLPSPILFYFVNQDTYYGFAGNRRTNFAWILGNPVKYFVVYVK